METCVVAHHWLIDTLTTNGLYHATCKNCGAEKNFPQQSNRLIFRMFKKPIPLAVVQPLAVQPAAAQPLAVQPPAIH